MKKLLVLSIVVVVILVVYLMLGRNQDQVTEISVVLNEQNESGESGVALLTFLKDSLKVNLDLAGAPEDVLQPAHIHEGSCEELGGVAHPLEFPVNGKSTTLLQLTMDDLKSSMPLAINVHKSTSEPQVYVACGNLNL